VRWCKPIVPIKTGDLTQAIFVERAVKIQVDSQHIPRIYIQRRVEVAHRVISLAKIKVVSYAVDNLRIE
jgi:hypothetical protein